MVVKYTIKNGTYDTAYCEEITCELNNAKYHPMEFGCDGKNFKHSFYGEEDS